MSDQFNIEEGKRFDLQNQFSPKERCENVLVNWTLFLTAPLWAPILFWAACARDKEFKQKFFKGKGLVGK